MEARRWVAVSLVAIGVFLLDQATKAVVRASLLPQESVPASGLFRITYARNTGMAFGLLPNQGLLLVAVSFLGIVLLLLFFRHRPLGGVLPVASAGMMLGGAAGNLWDRLWLGYVVDFVDLGPWPVFNVADSCIVVGVIVLVWLLYRPAQRRSSGERAVGGGEARRHD